MLSKSNLILAAAPTEMMAAQSFGLTLAHMAYRVGGGPHLFRANLPIPARGGLMMIDDAGFDGRGDPGPFCQEVMRECTARGYTGVICGFDRPFPLLGRVIAELSPLLERQGWPFYISELYARYSDTAKILIPTALSGGFFLPSPTGQGIPLSQEALQARIEERSPTIFFSGELCAHYFTYMNKQNGAHFILFDDASSIRKKLHVARTLDISDALLPYPEVADILPEILA